MENIKEAFNKVKQDTDSIKLEIDNLKQELEKTRDLMIKICEIIKEKEQTNKHIIPTNKHINQTNNPLFKPLNGQNLHISTGNQGDPTDRQTNRQTDRQADFLFKNNQNKESGPFDNSMDKALEILNSLDNIKKEIRLKFKRLSEKEFLVFSTLYQLTETQKYTDYKAISLKLGLSESSIRDYIGKLIKKGIPVEKIKENNKIIKLSISLNLKKVAPLGTILKLREI